MPDRFKYRITSEWSYGYIPEPPISPSEDDATYDRNCRNDLREEVMGAIDLIDENLAELDREGYPILLAELAILRYDMNRDMEA